MNIEQMQHNAIRAENLLKQLANKNRLLVLCHLIQGEAHVNNISEVVGLSQSAISQHLKKLKDEGLVESNKIGKHVFYRISSMEVHALLSTLYLIYCK